ncbi:MAG: hypothetical protein M3314_00750 [Actinomycetota bacterium]|nr:hypothetical protein [Actinomycetota bacterium]
MESSTGGKYDLASQPITATNIKLALASMDEVEHGEFVDGWAKCVELAEIHQDRESQRALLAYVRSWVVSILLREDPEWQNQMLETAGAVAEAETPLDADGLRKLLTNVTP